MASTTFVSTGRLPAREQVRSLVRQAYEDFRHEDGGRNSEVYPALVDVPRGLFGISVVATNGEVFEAGDVAVPFTIMSIAKPFVFALVCQALGPDAARARIGANATGLPFNAAATLERFPDGRSNPMVNAGAITTTSLVPGSSAQERWDTIVRVLSDFAGRPLEVDEEVYAAATATNHVNRALAYLLHSRGLLGCPPEMALDLYTRQSCLRVTAHEIAAMGATLADGGLNPLTGVQVLDAELCHPVLAVMVTAGLYETSGDWLYDVGLPGKSGISGGIVTVSPGKGGLGTFAPPLDAAGNSVRGQAATRFLSSRLGLDLLQSDRRGRGTHR